MKQLPALLAFIALVAAVSAIGSAVTLPAVGSWYRHIARPAWNPPDWVFGPVWTALYLMIAVAGWRVWRRLPGTPARRLRHPAMRAYACQLALNLLWSVIFFGFGLFTAAALEIVLLFAAIALTIRRFRAVDRPAAWLLVPYLLWVGFAVSLNLAIAVLN